ncbi:MAG: CRISPR-associated endonuclease Cas1 [Wolinella succinogenes]|uniref:CRISPR-associated endonuclease Cas1 n=1 Tax=Wolinella succinogenes TaxID=844 RepID=UPI00169B5966|nr:CRISPR-associated endonuclease Cas1 [Wolinella succinogenes]NLU33515.1 CRISPR-associated endonuclease Cas1 [Wolinella succinogenes]
MNKRVFIDAKVGRIAIESNTLFFGENRLPLRLVDTLIIAGGIEMSASTPIALSKAKIPVIFVGKNNRDFALLTPLLPKNADLKISQYEALSQKLEIAKDILKTKFITHQASLKEHEIDFAIGAWMDRIELAADIPSLLGIEGSFASLYFERYFSLFKKPLAKGFRSKQPPLDPINAMLSFVYTILYYDIAAKLVISGFEPSISYLHEPFRSHYALASDLEETVRADANSFVAKLFKEQALTSSDFSAQKGGVYLKNERRKELWNHLKDFLTQTDKKIYAQIALLRKKILKSQEDSSSKTQNIESA